MTDFPSVSRRNFLTSSSSTLLAGQLSSPTAKATETAAKVPEHRPLRLAAINSIYRLRSHAYHICGRMMLGYTRNGFHHQPPFQLVRMFNHQHPNNDLGPEHA